MNGEWMFSEGVGFLIFDLRLREPDRPGGASNHSYVEFEISDACGRVGG